MTDVNEVILKADRAWPLHGENCQTLVSAEEAPTAYAVTLPPRFPPYKQSGPEFPPGR